ncbi:MAG: LD-carboxypeptidase [Ignavibacteriaceae bacterium]|nr:LD-carboxypeptidase [Ignavibacteriaceae bacterium]
MRRRTFLNTITAAATVAALPNFSFPLEKAKIIKPKKLKTGDTIGLISPGGFITEQQLEESKTNISSLGFSVVAAKNILKRYGYLAGTDKERTEDLHEMFSNTKVDGIVCVRGGYGCARVLDFLDFNLIKRNPKILIGYSDITALLYGIFSQTGLIGFHGPVATSTFNEFSVNNFKNVLMNPQLKMSLHHAFEDATKSEYKPFVIRGGKAKGKLVGGNLSIVASLIGTKYDIDTKGKIIFLEEVGEEPYRVDRMLTQMIQAGKFKHASGIALGVFTKCESKPDESGIANSFSLSEVLRERLFQLGIPVLYGLSFGHIVNKFTLPFGINAELDVDNQSLTLLEKAVV